MVSHRKGVTDMLEHFTVDESKMVPEDEDLWERERVYLFVFNDDLLYEATDAPYDTDDETASFKNAVWKAAEHTGCNTELFEKSLKGFDETDIEGIVKLFNHFSQFTIEKVFLIKEKLYNSDER